MGTGDPFSRALCVGRCIGWAVPALLGRDRRLDRLAVCRKPAGEDFLHVLREVLVERYELDMRLLLASQ